MIVGLLPKYRTNDVILFDAASRECAVGFNPLACPDATRIDQVTSGVVSAFRKLHDSWGPDWRTLFVTPCLPSSNKVGI